MNAIHLYEHSEKQFLYMQYCYIKHLQRLLHSNTPPYTTAEAVKTDLVAA